MLRKLLLTLGIYNGIYTGLTYFRYDYPSTMDIILEIFANHSKTEAIQGIFMAPKWLTPFSQTSLFTEVEQSSSPATYNETISKQTTLNGHTPKNNKLKCFPYNYLLVSNNAGQNEILHYEKFSGSNCGFKVSGVLNPGCSINIIPLNYNGSSSSDINSITLGKFPICSFLNDMYQKWLAQNVINIGNFSFTSDDIQFAQNTISGTMSTLSRLSNGDIAGGVSGISDIYANTLYSVLQRRQHNMIPSSVEGQLNSADVNVALGNNTFHFYKMSIKKEYAEVIDNFFSMFGYKVNVTKVPNITGRQNWNYVKLVNPNIEGTEIPEFELNEYKKQLEEGITFWHNPLTFRDYSQSNSIVS